MSTLRLIISRSQKCLLANLADTICATPLPALENEKIVVLSHGMSRWMSMELAMRLGVAAGINFSFPNDILDQSFSAILPASPSSLPFTHASLTWRIAATLPTISRSKGFEQISAYLGDGRDDRRLLQISQSLAGCFDHYTIFRPEIICAWDDGDDDNWQAHLWRAITHTTQGSHRAAKLRALHQHVSHGSPPHGSVPRRISLFGISYLPPFHLEALRLLSSYCDVNCYLLNPCGEYWGTIISDKRKSRLALNSTRKIEAEEYYETGNPLLSSFGTLGQEFFESLLESGFEVEELEPAPRNACSEGDSPSPSLLSTIQNDIFTLSDRPAGLAKSSIAAADRSLQIHSCHGALREMEVLYDNLLDLFDRIPDLEPRHVVVMIPDIETYAPYISSVFGTRSNSRTSLPFTIADRSMRRESLFIDAFLKLISTASSRFALQETLDILELPPVLKRFDVHEDELLAIKNWLKECNVRWGFDADHRVDLGFPRYDDFSWQAGLDRLFLGYAMSPDDNATFNGILPYPDCSGDRADALGKLTEFITTIRKYSDCMSEPHTLPEWADILTTMVAHMLLPDETDSAGPLSIAKAIFSLNDAFSLYGFQQPIAITAVKDHLTETLAKNGGGYGFMGGGITFCAMLPMRSIPMRVIWLAGMNDGQFPRTEKIPGFSLMNGTRRRGDRSLRDEDRYLFLEALMAAEDCFCISYNGQSNRDNSILSPSVLVAELMDYVARGFLQPDGITPVSVLTRHRLQGFSPHYFDNTDPDHFFSYDRDSYHAMEAGRRASSSHREFVSEPLPYDSTSARLIDLQQLKRFLANPAAAFLEQRLCVTPFNPAADSDDSEPFSLDSLSSYNLSQELVRRMLQGAEYGECLTAARSLSMLPPLTAGTAIFDSLWEKCRLFAATLEPMRGLPLEPLSFSHTHANVHLNAALEHCQSGLQLRWRCAGMKGKDRLSVWIEHLILNAAKSDGYPLQSKMIASDMVLELPPIDNALDILNDILGVYSDGMKSPLKFFPETSWAFINGGLQKAEATWRGDRWRGFSGECDNQAVTLCFGGEEPWGDEFRALAERIYSPLLIALNT